MTLFIIVHGLICAFLVFVILLQPGKADAGIGFGSSSQSIFGSKGAGNFLTKTTSACAFLFLATSFFLTRSRIADQRGIQIQDIPAAPTAPTTPVAPTTPTDATKSAAPGQAPAASPGAAASSGANDKKAAAPVKTEESKKK